MTSIKPESVSYEDFLRMWYVERCEVEIASTGEQCPGFVEYVLLHEDGRQGKICGACLPSWRSHFPEFEVHKFSA